MALTAAQKVAVRLYAGWPARFFQRDSTLEGALAAVEALPDHEAQLVTLVTALADIDSKLTAAHARLKASSVGSIELNGAELGQLRSEGRRLVGRLCSILGISRGADVYGGSAPAYSNYVGR